MNLGGLNPVPLHISHRQGIMRYSCPSPAHSLQEDFVIPFPQWLHSV